MNKTDRKILTLAAALMLLMLYFLYDDSLILPSDDSGNLTAIGKISQMDHDVRRKISKQYLWRSARSNDTVHVGDSVFTGPGSSVEVQLSDGRKLSLQENSLIVFSSQGDQLKLDLQFGRVAGPSEGCVKITVKGQAQEVCGSNSLVEADDAKTVKKVAAPKESISWVEAPPAHFYYSKNKTPLKVSWKSDYRFSRYRFQLSRQEDFKKLTYELRTQNQELSTLGYPPRGEYFVRIQGDDVKGQPVAYSKIQKFDIQEAPLPEIVTPLVQSRISIPTNVDGDLLQNPQVSIEWKYPLADSKFDLEVASDKEFTKVVHRETGLTSKKALTTKLSAGNYFIRVRDSAVSGNTRRPWSNSASFQLEIQKPPALKAPELVTETVDYLAPTTEDLKLQWTPVEQAHTYHVEVSQDPEFSNIKEYSTQTPELIVKDVVPGKAYFRVTAETERGTESEASETGAIQVRLKTPVLNPVDPQVVMGKTPEDPGDPQTMKVSWSDLKIADSYVVEVAEDPEFKNKKEYQSPVPMADVTLPHPGDYYWRVKASSKSGKALSKYSPPGQMKYVLKVPLATPELMEPFDQATLFFQKNTSPYVWFEWKAVRQANQYLLEIATDPQFTQKVLSITSKSKRYLLKQQLPQSTLYWRVQAQGDDNRTSYWTSARQMNVFSGRAPASRNSSKKVETKEDNGR